MVQAIKAAGTEPGIMIRHEVLNRFRILPHDYVG
jgi:hypothetical protein